MEARLLRLVRVAAACGAFLVCVADSHQARAAAYATENFTVAAPTPQLAKEIGDTAEHWRRELALEWLGEELPAWSNKCPIKARVAPRLGAGGATSFVFDRGDVFDWRMNIQGSRERVLDSVVPHEVMHTIFASHFRQPLPRWADEGACTTVEHRSEISKQERMLINFLRTGKGIPFSHMFAMKEYPSDVMPLYAQGHSLSKFLIDQRGKQTFLEFLGEGMETRHWPKAVEEHYGYANLLELQNSWMDWIRQGRPEIRPQADILVASAETPVSKGDAKPENPQIRGRDRGMSVAAANAPITPTPRDDNAVGYGQASATAATPVDWPASNPAPTIQASNQVVQADASSRSSSSLRPSVYDASNNGGVFRR